MQAARIGVRRVIYRVLVEKPVEFRLLGRPRTRWKIKLKLILKKWNCGHELNRSDSGQGQVEGSYECGNEPSASIK